MQYPVSYLSIKKAQLKTKVNWLLKVKPQNQQIYAHKLTRQNSFACYQLFECKPVVSHFLFFVQLNKYSAIKIIDWVLKVLHLAHFIAQLFPHVQASACSQTKCQASYLNHACSTGIGPVALQLCVVFLCDAIQPACTGSGRRNRLLVVPTSFCPAVLFFLSRGPTRLCEDDFHLDSCVFAGHCSCSLAFHCHPTPVRPGLSHRTLNPVNESRPLFQAFFIPIPATSPRWNATRMPATGYLALESLCAEIGEAEREREGWEKERTTGSSLCKVTGPHLSLGSDLQSHASKVQEEEKSHRVSAGGCFQLHYLQSVGTFFCLCTNY